MLIKRNGNTKKYIEIINIELGTKYSYIKNNTFLSHHIS
jgi:hypothetical protein